MPERICIIPRRWALAALMVLAVVARTSAVQSLGDLAKQEEERRKAVTGPSKVISNRDLSPVPPSTAAPPPPPDSKAAEPSGSAQDGEKKDQSKDQRKDQSKDAKVEPVKDQAYWSGRLKALQTELDRDQTYSQALQSRINALTADFVNRDDPAQRAAIGRDRQKAVAELDRLKDAIQNDKKALAAFDEEARRASVPPGWLR
jgi:hypothetical protein